MTEPAPLENVEVPPALQAKLADLVAWLRARPSGAVTAFSAGVDSTLIAVLATRVLGTRALTVTATSPAFPERELKEAEALAASLGLHHRVIHSRELANPEYANNPQSRCYHCKTELYGLLRDIADKEGFGTVLDGTNADDVGDYRPGQKAGREKGVESPFRELGWTKEDIRTVAKALGIENFAKPAFACLASRFPYGNPITREALAAVDRAEEGLRAMGFGQLRVRVHGDLARVELDPGDVERALDGKVRAEITAHLRGCGYRYVTLDLEGYRQGSLNEVFKVPRPTGYAANP